MICKNCDALKTITNKESELLCYQCYGVKEPFVVKDINKECTEYNKEYWYNLIHKNNKNNDIQDSITFLKNWIKTDLHELNGDAASDYAQFILSGHKHINVAIEQLESIINPTRGYAE